MFLRLYKNFGDISYLDYARQYIEAALTRTTPTPNYVGFLGSYTGIYTTAAIIYNELGDTLKSSKYVDLMKTAIVEGQQCTEDTFYNGKAGLLMAARMLNNYFGEEVIPQSDILIIAQLLLEDGINNGRDGYLVWHNMIFPEVVFLGQGDGSTGVLTQLMQIPQIMANETATSYIKNTLDYYLTIQMPDGNFPTPVQSPYPDQADQLVQWCHGGPGFIPVLTLGYLAFGNEAYLRSADSAADLLWQKGILTKGLMLGHGVSGNTYMFLYMYEKTLNPKYLYRAIKFQEFTLGSPIMVDPTIMRVPSPSPYSLYGGSYGGAVVLWSDMLTGASYHMPGFDAYP
uniref:Squalene cyclase C-terminal domain-containing protein n=1 Tax=Arcella intermedia TaxID=1963864 RepID=A0A6B2L942_9EUKA